MRVTMFVGMAAAALHIAASFLWIAPYSDGARALFPGGQKALTAYMIPFFGQSWSVFAPEPINGDYIFRVRALTIEDGVEKTTSWVDATAVETAMIRHNLFPPRAGIGAGELASNYKAAWDALPADQKVIAGLGYFQGTTWPIRLKDKMLSYGEPALVADYLKVENMATKYATQVARATWGDSVQRVQFQVYRQNVVPFSERNDPNAKRPGKQLADTGWRGLQVAQGQSDRDFAETFRKAAASVAPGSEGDTE